MIRTGSQTAFRSNNHLLTRTQPQALKPMKPNRKTLEVETKPAILNPKPEARDLSSLQAHALGILYAQTLGL